MIDAVPPTLEELLESIKDFTVQRYRERARSTPGAVLAEEIRKLFPGFTYEQVGLDRLADAVSQAEQRGFVVRDRTVAHLEILPGPSSGVEAHASPVAKPQFLRPEVWRALVFVSPSSRNFMERGTGHIRSIPRENQAAIATHEADASFVEIPRITGETQQTWIREFIARRDDLPENEAPVDDPQWWIRVPEWLRSKGSDSVERIWRRERSERVITVAREWATENRVPERLLLAPPKPRLTESPKDKDSEAIRQAVLAALSEMTLHEMKDLSIPFRYVIRHFRAR